MHHLPRFMHPISRWIVPALLLLLMGAVVCFVVLDALISSQPSAESLALVFAGLPANTPLPQGEFDGVTRADLSLIADTLRAQLPPGSTEQQVRDYIQARGQVCDDREGDIRCFFESRSIPCRVTVTVVFSFNPIRALADIQVRFGQICF